MRGMATPRLRRRASALTFGAAVVLAFTVASAVPAGAVSGGAALWVSRFRAGNLDIPTALGVDPGGERVYVTGTSVGDASGFDYATVAQDAVTGARLWANRYNSPGNGDDFANALAVSPDGARVFVTGESEHNYATVAYDAATGAKIWASRYTGPVDDASARAVAVSPDGALVFVTGQGFKESTGSYFVPQYVTIAYDAATGAKVWAQRYRGVGRSTVDGATAVAVSPDGADVYVTGNSSGGSATHADYATLAYDAVTGAERWLRRYNSPGDGNDYADGLAASGSMVYVTGSTSYGRSGGEPHGTTIAYDTSTGTKTWARRFTGRGVAALALSADGTAVYVTGVGPTDPTGYMTVDYDAVTGAKVWSREYSGPGGSYQATALAISPDGSRGYVTGYTSEGTSHMYATVAFDAGTGAKLKALRYDGPGDGEEVAWAIGVSPDGARVYVTGESRNNQGDLDYATLAYGSA